MVTDPLTTHSTSLGQWLSLKMDLKMIVKSASVIVADWLGTSVNSLFVVVVIEGGDVNI